MHRVRRVIAVALVALTLLAPGCVTLSLADQVARTWEQPQKTLLCAAFPFALVADVASLPLWGLLLILSPNWLDDLLNDERDSKQPREALLEAESRRRS